MTTTLSPPLLQPLVAPILAPLQLGGTSTGTVAVPSPAPATPAVVARREERVQRFVYPPASTPKAYFHLLGKQFISYVTSLSVQLGRSKLAPGSQIHDEALERAAADTLANAMAASAQPAAPVPSSPLSQSPSATAAAAALSSASALPPALISLGNDHTISRAHISLAWNAHEHRWEARALGKNGFWLDRVKHTPQGPVATPGSTPTPTPPSSSPGPGSAPVVVLPADRASLLRIGVGEDATMFYFVPALDPSTSAGAAAAASGATTVPDQSQLQQPKVKKRRKSASGSGGGGGDGDETGGAAPISGDKPKKRRKSAAPPPSGSGGEAAQPPAAGGIVIVPPPPPSSSRVDSDDFIPLNLLPGVMQ